MRTLWEGTSWTWNLSAVERSSWAVREESAERSSNASSPRDARSRKCARNDEQVGFDRDRTERRRHARRRQRGRRIRSRRARRFVDESAEQLAGLDVFVMNASGAFGGGNDEGSWRRGVEVDILGTVAGCEAAIPHLNRLGAGAIVAGGTVSAIEARPRRAYNSARPPSSPNVKSIARELAPAIRANDVSPGQIDFEGGVWDLVKQHARSLPRGTQPQPDATHGHTRPKSPTPSPSSPARERLHQRHEPPRRRRPHPERPVLSLDRQRWPADHHGDHAHQTTHPRRRPRDHRPPGPRRPHHARTRRQPGVTATALYYHSPAATSSSPHS